MFKDGAWGFAHSNVFSDEAVLATVKKAFNTATLSAAVNKDKKLRLAPERSYLATYKTPVKIDPFSIPVSEKIDLMMEVSRTMLAYEGIKKTIFLLMMQKDEKLFASTLGTRLDLTTQFINPMITAVAVTENDSQSRTFDDGGRAVGWEWILELDLLDKANRLPKRH